MRFSAVFLVLSATPLLLAATPGGYVGAAACGGCHKDIAVRQAKSNMRLTWQPALPSGYDQSKKEDQLSYRVRGGEHSLTYSMSMPGQPPVELPVETVVGGERHGLSFLVRLKEFQGFKLDRAPLIETRYLQSTHAKGLALSPGFPEQLPTSYESALGRVLSPEFEQKCLSCHGLPSEGPKPQAGVHCETCHGPGQAHLTAVAKGESKGGIIAPAKLSNAEQVEQCSRCHSGFSRLNDPMPPDLLISNQVNAMKNSECYVQSDAGFTCTSCHDPHANGIQQAAFSNNVCLSCHALQAQKAASCPVNAKTDCVTCHMPTETRGPFSMVNHWIGVYPERGGVSGHEPASPSHVRPRREFLRLLTAKKRSEAEQLRQRIEGGESFFQVAWKNSTDATSTSGGYLGETWLKDVDPALASTVAPLRPGKLSAIIEKDGSFAFYQRLPRDFRWQALQLEEEASRLRTDGKMEQAAAKYTESLQVYPRFLRALIFLAVSAGELGQVPRAAAILEHANRLYPGDPAVLYNLGISYGVLQKSAEEMQTYKAAIEAQPDLIPAYLNLGAAYVTAGKLDDAVETYQRAIRINPLAGSLYYSLAQVRQQQGQADDAKRLLMIAAKLDPKLR